jgi:hypothetical protein
MAGQAREIQRLLRELERPNLTTEQHRDLLTLHHTAIFRLFYQSEISLENHKVIVCTYSYLLRFLSGDRNKGQNNILEV